MTHPDPSDRFAVIYVPPQSPVPVNAVSWGSYNAVMENIVDSRARNDAIDTAAQAVVDAVEAEQRRDEALATTARTIADTAALLTNRLDAFVARRDERARRHAECEEEEERQRIADELTSLPDPDDPGVHENTGDLHTLSHHDQVEFEPPEDPSGTVIPQPTAIEFDEA